MSGPVGAVDGLLGGRYRLTERLATGGMGEVWRGVDVLLDRPVAVKTLRPELSGDDTFRQRFRAEARHTARLAHPGVASVYDFGELPDQAWLVMELVDGEPLSALLRAEGRLSAARTLDVVAQTAAALQAAHEVGLVHRDVKPGNLLIRADGRVKVTDFGIASAADGVPLTLTGQVLGTASYLSPEQAAGHSGTPASDLYALGVVAYECLAGEGPFVADSPVAVILAHLQSPPPPLPDHVPAPVRSLVERLLAKDPHDRPGSADELAREARALRGTLAAGGDVAGPEAGARAVSADSRPATTAPTRLLPAPSLSAHPAPQRRPARSYGPTSRRTQRWAVRATALLLALLAVALGLSGAWNSTSAVVPEIPVGTPETQAAAALVAAGLEPLTQRVPSAAVPAGQVVSLQPAAGTDLERGDEVSLVVSSGPAPAAPAEPGRHDGGGQPGSKGESDEVSPDGAEPGTDEDKDKDADEGKGGRDRDEGKAEDKGKDEDR